MERLRSIILIWWLGVCASCADSSSVPRLFDISPARVTSLAATHATVHGDGLDAAVRVDLDSTAAPSVDRGWQVRIDATAAVDPVWRDRQTLEVVLPRGLATGVHDVIAIAPDGRELVLPAALIVSDDPVGLALSIEDAADGTGHEIAGTLVAGEQRTAFAIARDAAHAFVTEVPVEWGTSAMIGTLSGGAGAQVTLTATTVGTAQLTAHHAGAALDARSGDLTVIAGPSTTLAIVDPGGVRIGDRSGLTTDADGGLTAIARAYDAYGNSTGEVSVGWSLTGVTAALPAVASSTVALDFATPGIGVLRATHATLGTATTGALAVVPGRAATLTIAPRSLALSADAAPITFSATGVDGDGNATTNLGTLTWSVASGPITAIDPATGALDPRHAGVGTIGVASSWGATATSGAITIAAGAPASVTVAPSSLAVSADAPPVTFTASAADADGNPLAAAAATWSIASGPITAIDPSTGTFDPRIAGSGTIRATVGAASATAPVTVTPGRAKVLAVAPDTLDIAQGTAGVPFTVAAKDADGNSTVDLGAVTWSIATGAIAAIDATTGTLTPSAPGIGTVRATSSYGVSDDTGVIRIRASARLTASISVDAVTAGSTGTVTMVVSNPGEVDALGVAPCALMMTGPIAIASGPLPASVTIAAGASVSFTWSISASAAGPAQVTSCATGSDAATGASIASSTTSVSFIVQSPAQLAATLTIPSLIGRGATFTATMVVTNSGQAAATAVTPSALTASGTSGATLVGPAPGGVSIAGGGTATFTWTYRAGAIGTLRLTGSVSASGMVVIASVASNQASVVEHFDVATDPFGDGSSFGYVTGYRGEVYLGPNRTGAAAVRFLPDGSNQQSLAFTFTKDLTGNRTSNTSAAYTSLGATGCTANTPACGPDNENGRGTFTGVTLSGVEWLVAQGSITARSLTYLYMTTDSDPVLDFRYVDLSVVNAGGEEFGGSALVALGNVLYVGILGRLGSAPTLYALSSVPSTAPGLEASNPADIIDLGISSVPGIIGSSTQGMIDTMTTFNGVLYLGNGHAIVRATVPVPRPYSAAPGDWAVITPQGGGAGKPSRLTMKTADLEPADRAIPQMAAFGGMLFLGRNTTTGPQLWACDPAISGVASQCDSGDWKLIAANSTGDTALSQFNDPSLTSISMVVATSQFLYVGFDSTSGLQLFRTANPAAATRADFEGANGCSAAAHPATCDGFGGAGLGDPADTRILDGKALTLGGTTAVWMTIGNGSSPLELVMLP